jgi:hypothetical protein
MLTKMTKMANKSASLSKFFTVYSNQQFVMEETYGRKKFRYDANLYQYNDLIKVYLQRRRIHKDEICKGKIEKILRAKNAHHGANRRHRRKLRKAGTGLFEGAESCRRVGKEKRAREAG